MSHYFEVKRCMRKHFQGSYRWAKAFHGYYCHSRRGYNVISIWVRGTTGPTNHSFLPEEYAQRLKERQWIVPIECDESR